MVTLCQAVCTRHDVTPNSGAAFVFFLLASSVISVHQVVCILTTDSPLPETSQGLLSPLQLLHWLHACFSTQGIFGDLIE